MHSRSCAFRQYIGTSVTGYIRAISRIHTSYIPGSGINFDQIYPYKVRGINQFLATNYRESDLTKIVSKGKKRETKAHPLLNLEMDFAPE